MWADQITLNLREREKEIEWFEYEYCNIWFVQYTKPRFVEYTKPICSGISLFVELSKGQRNNWWHMRDMRGWHQAACFPHRLCWCDCLDWASTHADSKAVDVTTFQKSEPSVCSRESQERIKDKRAKRPLAKALSSSRSSEKVVLGAACSDVEHVCSSANET